MKLTVWRFGCAVATVWSLCVFFAGLANLLFPPYAEPFLKALESIYPGYTLGKWGIGGVIVGALYAALDAWILGAFLAWFYNLYAKLGKPQD